MLADGILLIRVFAVYPPRLLSKLLQLVVYGPIVLVKIARLVNCLIYAVRWASKTAENTTLALQAGQDAWNSPSPKIEWVLMLFDTS